MVLIVLSKRGQYLGAERHPDQAAGAHRFSSLAAVETIRGSPLAEFLSFTAYIRFGLSCTLGATSRTLGQAPLGTEPGRSYGYYSWRPGWSRP